jgi:hypothetical protein
MNHSPQDPRFPGSFSGSFSGSAPDSFQATLRVIANLPLPEGLEDRVRRALRTAPRESHLLPWPSRLKPKAVRLDSSWVTPSWIGAWSRAAAAVAIGVVVVGGGWGVYSRVERTQPQRVIVFPHSAVGGGFSSAGAMRTPETLNGPVLVHPLKPNAAPTKAKAKPARPSKAPAPLHAPGAHPAAPTAAPTSAPLAQ